MPHCDRKIAVGAPPSTKRNVDVDVLEVFHKMGKLAGTRGEGGTIAAGKASEQLRKSRRENDLK